MEPGIVEAVLVTGDGETPYRRAGAGPAVLLLTRDTDLMEPLARRLRVVQPLRGPDPRTTPDWHRWLQAVVDGLGLERPALVVDPDTAAAARGLAALDPHRFGPVVEAGPVDAIARLLTPDEIIDV